MKTMFGGVNASVSGSLEAALIKSGDININIKDRSSARLGNEGFIPTLSKVIRTKQTLKAHDAEVDWDIKCAKKIKFAYPWWSDERCLLEARGYRMTSQQAENFTEVSSRASVELDSKGVDPEPLDEEKLDSIVEGAKTAYTDEAKNLWAALLARELEGSGSYTKLTMRMLKEMESSDAILFSEVCACCSGGSDEQENKYQTIPLIFLDEDGVNYNDGAFSYSDLARLESIGLVKLGATTFFGPNQNPFLHIGGKTYVLIHQDNRISLGNLILTSFGEEIASLCAMGGAEGLSSLVVEKMSAQKAQLVELPDDLNPQQR